MLTKWKKLTFFATFWVLREHGTKQNSTPSSHLLFINNQLIITSTLQRLFRFPSLSAIAVILKDCLFVYSVTYCECYEPQQRLDSEQTAVSHKSSTHLSTSILETLLVRTKCLTSCTVLSQNLSCTTEQSLHCNTAWWCCVVFSKCCCNVRKGCQWSRVCWVGD